MSEAEKRDASQAFSNWDDAEALKRVDKVCNDFGEAWKAGMQPEIEEYLPTVANTERGMLLYVLILLDLDFRRGDCGRPSIDEYLKRFPDDQEQVQSAFAQLQTPSEMANARLHATLEHASGSNKAADPGSVSLAADGTTPPVDAAIPSGGRFRILRPHAEGGLRRVSVAHDTELRREVAFKELRQRYADDPDHQSRFVAEAEITGSLEHAGVVPIYAMGHHANGRPFYAMRLIHGQNMTEAIKQFHETNSAERDRGKRALALRKLLRRFGDVCNAIQYAHSRGVLHRDLKPSNVMLGKHGETLVVDWGLAKLIGRQEDQPSLGEVTVKPSPTSGYAATRMGKAVGTPQYMSPEQAEGRLDELRPASDIYGLGAILYEILTGRPPFEGRDSNDVLEAVKQGDFPRPRSIRRQIPAPLEAICLNAMALRVEDRYATAAAVVEDLEHWLADEPVTSYREPLLERLARWRRRHRAWARAGAAALLLLTTVSIVAAILVNEARRREHVARGLAVQRLRDAREAVDGWLIGAADSLQYYPGAQEDRKRLLRKAADSYTEFVQQSSDDPELELERGRVYLRLGDVHLLLEESSKAEKEYRAAASLFERLSGTHPQASQCRLEWANSYTRLAMVFAETGRHRQAGEAYGKSISELRKLAAADPKEPQFCDSLATALLNRGLLLQKSASLEEAEKTTRQAIDEFEILLGLDDDPRYRAGVATARSVLAEILIKYGRNEEASHTRPTCCRVTPPSSTLRCCSRRCRFSRIGSGCRGSHSRRRRHGRATCSATGSWPEARCRRPVGGRPRRRART